MGNNLSTFVVPDLTGVTFSPEDQLSAKYLISFWVGCSYVFAMIFFMLALIDRWRGPLDKIRTEPGHVLGAFILSAAWPAVAVFLFMSG